MKKCPHCQQTQPLEQFGKNKTTKDGLSCWCKSCQKKSDKKYYKQNQKQILTKKKRYYTDNKAEILDYKRQYRNDNLDKEKAREAKSREKHKEKRRLKAAQYRSEHPEQRKQTDQQYYQKNKDKIKQRATEYYQEHKQEINQKRKIQKHNRYKNDVQFRLQNVLRKRLNEALKADQKTGSAIKDLGCSIDQLKLYLENQFVPHPITGEMMTWENWSRNGWHIDHVIPLSSFNLADREQLVRAVHYTNLQPLWAIDNLKKGNKT